MDGLNGLWIGFMGILNAESLLFCLSGVVLGIFVGALPGMGPSAGIAVLLPIVFGMSAKNALIMLCALYYGAMFGSAITAILLNIPGESSAVICAFEGHKLAKRGLGGKALGISSLASFIGAIAGTVGLALFAPQLAEWALKFGPAELLTMILLAFLLISGLSNDSVPKSFASLMIGLLMAVIGLDSLSGRARLTFGSRYLLDGLDSVAVILGFFALAEIMVLPKAAEDSQSESSEVGRAIPTLKEFIDTFPAIMRGTVIGFITGVMPGSGATTATFLSYGIEKKFSKHADEIGNGSMDAVAASESSNNAAAAGAMVPLMSLAIPGSATAAVLLSAFIMFGLQPGPQLFSNNPDVAWSIIAGMFLASIVSLVVNLCGLRFFTWIIRKAMPFVAPLVATVLVAGIYSINNQMKDVWIMIACGIIGYVMTKLSYPLVPALLGLVLGAMVENNFRRALTISQGDLTTFLDKPICLVFIAIGVGVMVIPPLAGRLKKLKKK